MGHESKGRRMKLCKLVPWSGNVRRDAHVSWEAGWQLLPLSTKTRAFQEKSSWFPASDLSVSTCIWSSSGLLLEFLYLGFACRIMYSGPYLADSRMFTVMEPMLWTKAWAAQRGMPSPSSQWQTAAQVSRLTQARKCRVTQEPHRSLFCSSYLLMRLSPLVQGKQI